ncbi:MAG: glycosyltransferase family 2 protein, partial [Endomicrobiia bacterium]|nr:glycosyltransferase family 2 protein [Endomicrobiia bacterium]
MPVQQKPSPRVSVMMNCHNSARYLKEAIDSVYSQTFGDFEIIFWDNASTDSSAEIAKSYTDGRLRYFRSDEKTTLGKARNLALKKSEGEYVTFLDCDDIWLPEKLEKQVAAFERGKADFVYSNYYIYNQRKNVKKLAFSGPQPEGLAFEDLFLRYPIGILTVALKISKLSAMEELFDESLTC